MVLSVLLRSEVFLTIVASVVPILGIWLGWWSFKFAEFGATPDDYPDPGQWWDDQKQMLHGQRSRARESARITFLAGGLLLTAAVPLGQGALHTADQLNLLAIVGYAFIVLCVLYCWKRTIGIWRARRNDAFNLYWSKEMPALYDEAGTRRAFFQQNPMPIWTLPDRQWFRKLKRPDVHDLPARRELDA